MQVRLDTVATDVVTNLRQADSQALRSVARTVASLAAERSGLRDRRLDAGLTAIRENVWKTDGLKTDLSALIDELDEEAWDIQDQVGAGTASQDDYIRAFRRARAASAVTFALDPNPFTAAVEATYEANAALEDLDLIRTVVRNALTNSG